MKEAKEYITPYISTVLNGLSELDLITIENIIEQAQKDAFKLAIKLVSESAKLKTIEYDYGGVRSGCKYYTTIIDKQSILDLKK